MEYKSINSKLIKIFSASFNMKSQLYRTVYKMPLKVNTFSTEKYHTVFLASGNCAWSYTRFPWLSHL